MEQGFVVKECELRCPRGKQEVELAMVVEAVVVIEEVVVVDLVGIVVDRTAEVAHEAEVEVENAVVLGGLHPIVQCPEAEVGQLPLQEEEDLDQHLVRIN